MSITVLLVLIIVLAFVVGGVVQSRLPRLATRSGMEFALLGVVLGQEVGLGVLGNVQLHGPLWSARCKRASTVHPRVSMVPRTRKATR